MAIPLKTNYLFVANETNSSFATIKFQLALFSDSVGIEHPNKPGVFITLKAIKSNVTGTLVLVSPGGNETVENIIAGDIIHGPINGVKLSGAITVVPADVICYA